MILPPRKIGQESASGLITEFSHCLGQGQILDYAGGGNILIHSTTEKLE
jgi:hypothetical protein